VSDYDSTADTLKHSLRVGELMAAPITELVERSTQHDRSKTEEPELSVFNRYTPKLHDSTYGSEEYKGFLAGMGEGLAHHYACNRHHPEHFAEGLDNMTLVDLLEMLADWKAATERHADGDLAKSLQIQQERFGISDQLLRILANTAGWYGWLNLGPDMPLCGVKGKAPNSDGLVCNRLIGPHRCHADGLMDGLEWVDGQPAGFGDGEWSLAGSFPARTEDKEITG
jgi:hypothetical protein